jgi:hypothetical protein
MCGYAFNDRPGSAGGLHRFLNSCAKQIHRLIITNPKIKGNAEAPPLLLADITMTHKEK